MYQSLIFLDFDGVLNDYFEEVTEEALSTLKILKWCYDAKLVIISSRLENGTTKIQKELLNYFEELGFSRKDVDFIDPNFEPCEDILSIRGQNRVPGIIHYLNQHIGSSYIILDDECKKDYQYFNLNHYETGTWRGLRRVDLEMMQFKKYVLPIHFPYHHRKMNDIEEGQEKLIRVLKKVLTKKLENDRI